MNDQAWNRLRAQYPWPTSAPDVPQDLQGWFLPENAAALGRALRPLTAPLVLELGTWKGKSAHWMLETFQTSRLVCVDLWDPAKTYGAKPNKQHLAREPHVYETCLRNLWAFRDRCVLLRADTLAGMAEVGRFGLVPDVVYVDAAHWFDDVRQDVAGALALAPRAVLVGDDWRHPQVRRAVREVLTPAGRVVMSGDNCWESWP